MIRKLLESKIGHVSNAEFEIICEIVTDDLKFNRLGFGKYTNLNYVIDIAVKSAVVFQKCA
jgi:hypothetical protein